MKKILLSTLIFCPLFAICQLDSLRAHFAAGQEEYKSGNYQGFLDHMLKANEFRAYYPPVLYNIAAGYSLVGQSEKALGYLKTFSSFNAAINFEEDSDFAGMAGSDELKQVRDLQARLSETSVSSVLMDSIPGTVHIESIAFNYKSATYYLGDVRERKVQQFMEGKLSDMVTTSHPDFYGVMGLDVDTKNQLLWICTAALPQMRNYSDSLAGHSSLFSYDLKAKKLQHHKTLRQGSAFGDLIVGAGGEVLISDGTSNRIYQYANGKMETVADLSGQVTNLQGLTLAPDQKSLYLSDYISGIYRLDRPANTLTRVSFAAGTPFKGIDGLYRVDNELIGLENGSKPLRAVKYTLSRDGLSVLDYQILDQGADFLGEPTQGVLVGKDFIYISNSPWGLYSKENEFPEAQNTLILRKISINIPQK